MASIIDSGEEHPEYPFDHVISIKLRDLLVTWNYRHAGYVAIDSFTDQIYVLLVNSIGLGSLLICTQSGELQRTFSYKKMEDTHCMAIHKNNVYVALGSSCILHFEVTDSMSLIGSKNDGGSRIGEFVDLRHFDVSNEGDLFVADFGNNRMQILDGNLQYKRHISHHSMLRPCDVKLRPDEVYVFGDSPEESTHCIHIFTRMGEKIRSIILNGIPNTMQYRGFCLDTYGNVIIIDYANSQI